AARSAEVAAVLERHPLREFVTSSSPLPLQVDRKRALFGAWYEFFPRSEGAVFEPQTGAPAGTPAGARAGGPRSGTFRTAMRRLPAIADMGFDVVYLPPIHPIGHTARKGANNSPVAEPGDPGVPWAIGAPEGGHDAIHSDLGTMADFEAFLAHARELGMEVAMDFALQASPDHPWVEKHPDWFRRRPDGSIAYAENPPKKYQDIYPVAFDQDPEGILAECLRIIRFWMGHGVRAFRCDNPHTKPVSFWERLIGEINASDPDVIFLSESYSRPAFKYALAAAGFHQSYTYFTWRNSKWEIESYLGELTGEPAAYLRPNLWVNTPDVLHAYLQHGGPPAFKIRATLAAMLSPAWGMYSGFELCENVALHPGSEEYLDSEKYQYKPRDWHATEHTGRSIAPYIARLNELRRRHPALQELRNLRFHHADNDGIIAFSKRAHPGDTGTGAADADNVEKTVIVIVNLDPHSIREATVSLTMPELGLDWYDRFAVHDELTGASYLWGEHNYVRLDPFHQPAHIFTVRRSVL
ncbi:MAG: alpha-1,4-glucan--maltose-1-phosphate maltosyltransferase, partial [Nocardioidaceae bacterium]